MHRRGVTVKKHGREFARSSTGLNALRAELDPCWVFRCLHSVFKGPALPTCAVRDGGWGRRGRALGPMATAWRGLGPHGQGGSSMSYTRIAGVPRSYGAATRGEQVVVATAASERARIGCGRPDAHSGVEETRGCHNVTVSKSAGVAVVSSQRALWLSARSVELAFQGELPGGR